MAKKQLTPDQLFSIKVKHLLNAETSMQKRVAKFQQKLYDLLLEEYLPKFDVEDGLIVNNAKNARLLAQIDTYFDKLSKEMYSGIIQGFAKDLKTAADMSADYYLALEFDKKLVNSILKDTINLDLKLGIDSKGKLNKKGYLYRLGQTDQVRQQLRNYVLSSLAGDTPFADFQLGMRNLVIGNKRKKGLDTVGRLERYFDQFAYDSFNEIDAAVNSQFAQGLDLKHFVYEGSLIDTSRRFCEKRAGKAFTVEETKTWKDDPDLIEKKTKDEYKPLIHRGRYRCRHFIKYITEATYKFLKKKRG